MQRTFRTPKGTDLPLFGSHGERGGYLEVRHRLVWFREEHPDWAIETELLSITQDSAFARATIKDHSGRVIATSHKFETRDEVPDFIEKAETGAIGRALILVGFGTEFCEDELEPSSQRIGLKAADYEEDLNPGDYRITFGHKFKGLKLRDISKIDLEGYVDWLEARAARKGLPISEEVRFFKSAVERYLASLESTRH